MFTILKKLADSLSEAPATPLAAPPTPPKLPSGIFPWVSLETPPTHAEIDAALARGTKYFDFDPLQAGAIAASHYIRNHGGYSVAYHVGGGAADWGEKEFDLTSPAAVAAIVADVRDFTMRGAFVGIHLDNIDRVEDPKLLGCLFRSLEKAADTSAFFVVPKNHTRVVTEMFDLYSEADIHRAPYSWQEQAFFGEAEELQALSKHIPLLAVEFEKTKAQKYSVSAQQARDLSTKSWMTGVYHMRNVDHYEGRTATIYRKGTIYGSGVNSTS